MNLGSNSDFAGVMPVAGNKLYVMYNDGNWYRCKVIAFAETGMKQTTLNQGLDQFGNSRVTLKSQCAHVRFFNGDEDDVVKIDSGKYGKTRVYRNSDKAYAWVYNRSEINQHTTPSPASQKQVQPND